MTVSGLDAGRRGLLLWSVVSVHGPRKQLPATHLSLAGWFGTMARSAPKSRARIAFRSLVKPNALRKVRRHADQESDHQDRRPEPGGHQRSQGVEDALDSEKSASLFLASEGMISQRRQFAGGCVGDGAGRGGGPASFCATHRTHGGLVSALEASGMHSADARLCECHQWQVVSWPAPPWTWVGGPWLRYPPRSGRSVARQPQVSRIDSTRPPKPSFSTKPLSRLPG